MVIDLDKFAETVIDCVLNSKELNNVQNWHKDYVIKKNFIKQVFRDGIAIDGFWTEQSIVFFRNSSDNKLFQGCLVTWNFDEEFDTQLITNVRVYTGVIEKDRQKTFFAKVKKVFNAAQFSEIIRTIIEAIL